MAEGKFPELGELVLCKVRDIQRTTIFVGLEKYKKVGVIPTSEIAPGRIRNIRDYVVINKKIICKVMRVDEKTSHIDLSLRRVTQKETKEEMDKYQKEDIALKIIQMVLKEDAGNSIELIKKEHPSLNEFFELSLQNPEILKKYFPKDKAEKIAEIIRDKIKKKIIVVKAILSISSNESNGLTLIKNALLKQKNVKILYIGAPNYLIVSENENPKTANKNIEDAVLSVTELMKHHGKVEVKSKE